MFLLVEQYNILVDVHYQAELLIEMLIEEDVHILVDGHMIYLMEIH